MATTFLTLPSEIRTIILKHALNARRSPPLNPWTGKDRRRPAHDINYAICNGHGPRNTLYETFTHHDNLLTSTPLLLINHQIHNEVNNILHHNRSYKPIYHLDIMYVNEDQLWPTWVAVPCLNTHMDEITVDIRIFGHCISREALRYLCGDGGREGVHWCFQSLLERFLVRGPVGVRVDDATGKADTDTSTERQLSYYDWSNGRSPHRFSVRMLVLDIKSGGG